MSQITDRILLSVRNDIDSIPNVTSEQIDAEFVKLYNNLSSQGGKKVNRTEMIRNVYNQLNTYFIEDNNRKLSAGTLKVEPYTEKVRKFDVGTQKRKEVEITYKDSVRIVEMSNNEKVEWRNSIKKKAWTDVKSRMKGIYFSRLETTEVVESIPSNSVVVDSVVVDSIRLDSFKTDSVVVDTVKMEAFNSFVTCRNLSLPSKDFFISLREPENEE
jgi:hypothetical protein